MIRKWLISHMGHVMLLFFSPSGSLWMVIWISRIVNQKNGWLMTIGAYTGLVDDHRAKTC